MKELSKRYVKIKDYEKRYKGRRFQVSDLDELYALIWSCLQSSFRNFDIPNTIMAKSVIIASKTFNIETPSTSPILPTIHLYGPELIGDKEILLYSPYLKRAGGDMIGSVQPDKHVIPTDNRAIARIREKYDSYLNPLEGILEHILGSLSDMIDLTYDVVFERPYFTGSHNIMTPEEAMKNIVWNTLCRNMLRVKRTLTRRGKRNFEIPDNTVNFSISNHGGNIECLKDGTKNDMVIFQGIYLMNAMGLPTGNSKDGPGEYLYRLLSCRYFKDFGGYYKEKKELDGNKRGFDRGNFSGSDYSKYDRILKNKEAAVSIARDKANATKKNVKFVVDSLLQNLIQCGAVYKKGNTFLVNGSYVNIDGVLFDMPSKDIINGWMRNIWNLNAYLKKLRREFSRSQHRANSSRDTYYFVK
ncbi:hypothetical protein BMS3Bbin15_00963 [archaeon BMS3Bbin15]|nr:hypothetical protein BMS3Bbin15_00963 [archaeon BMS3Bbin15]